MEALDATAAERFLRLVDERLGPQVRVLEEAGQNSNAYVLMEVYNWNLLKYEVTGNICHKEILLVGLRNREDMLFLSILFCKRKPWERHWIWMHSGRQKKPRWHRICPRSAAGMAEVGHQVESRHRIFVKLKAWQQCFHAALMAIARIWTPGRRIPCYVWCPPWN